MALGGRTIAELQAVIGWREVAVWQAFRARNGPMTDVRRYDRPAALIAATIANAAGHRVDQAKFMPFGQEASEGNMDDIINKLGGVKIAR